MDTIVLFLIKKKNMKSNKKPTKMKIRREKSKIMQVKEKEKKEALKSNKTSGLK